MHGKTDLDAYWLLQGVVQAVQLLTELQDNAAYCRSSSAVALQKIGSSSLGRDRFCRSAAFCRGALSWELCVISPLVLCADTANCGINRQKYAISIMLRSQGDCVYICTCV